MDSDDVVIVIPDGGGYLTVEAGTTVIDFYDGTITAPSTTTHLRKSLRNHDKTHLNSLFFYSSLAVKVSTDGVGFITVEADQTLNLTHYKFDQLYIVAAAECDVRLITSTNPEMAAVMWTGYQGTGFSQGQVTIGITATLISAKNPSRKSLIIWNSGAATVYVGGPNVTVAGALQGLPVVVGGSLDITSSIAAVYGITVAGGTVNYLEG